MSTIEAILSTRDNLDLLYPDRMTYIIHHRGSILYTKFDMVDDQIKVIGGSLINMKDARVIYVVEDKDESEFIEPITLSMCCFSLGYIMSDNDPVIIKWKDGEISEIHNSIIK